MSIHILHAGYEKLEVYLTNTLLMIPNLLIIYYDVVCKGNHVYFILALVRSDKYLYRGIVVVC